MKVFNKLLVLGTMLLSIGFTNSKVKELYAVDTTIEDMKKYDENIELGALYFENGDFNSPFNSHVMLRGGTNYDALYRGVTSCNEKESDIYAFYDKRENNTFVRMANFNGTGGKRTRLSSYYYDTKLDVPSNLKKTDYFNVSFSYRLYASEVERMSLNGKDAIFRWQSRGSADTKSCDVLFKDLVLNEPGDYTWHTYSYRVSCKNTMTTDYGWFFFNYYNFEPKQSPTYYADIDNFSVALDDGVNTVKQNGTFEFLYSGTPYLQDSNKQDEIYHDFYNRPDYGDSIYQDVNKGEAYLRMDANKNKSSFTYKLDRDFRNDQVIYINFDYKNISYYEEPDLDLMVDGKNGTVYENIIGKEVYSENYISYVKEGKNGWNNQSIYLTVKAGHVDTLDFLLEYGGDLTIDNLVMADFKSIDYTSGNYTEFKTIYDNFLETVGDYGTKYIPRSIELISKAIEAGNKITEYSSQTKMDRVIELINNALANLEEKGDLDKVLDYIDQIFDEMAGTNKNDYDLRLYIKFKYALEEAIKLDEGSSKEEVDKAYENLKEAYENMTRKESE